MLCAESSKAATSLTSVCCTCGIPDWMIRVLSSWWARLLRESQRWSTWACLWTLRWASNSSNRLSRCCKRQQDFTWSTTWGILISTFAIWAKPTSSWSRSLCNTITESSIRSRARKCEKLWIQSIQTNHRNPGAGCREKARGSARRETVQKAIRDQTHLTLRERALVKISAHKGDLKQFSIQDNRFNILSTNTIPDIKTFTNHKISKTNFPLMASIPQHHNLLN